MTTVALMVSGHGYGHAVRSSVVAQALLDRGCRVLVRSDAPHWLFPAAAEQLASPGWPLDIGVVQHNGLELDLDATRAAWTTFALDFDARAESEAEQLKQLGVNVVLADIAPLGIAAAARAGIPSAVMTNFTWDWIYAEWPRFTSTIDTIQRAYGQADVLLRLPLHSHDPSAFSAFSRIEDVPLVARHACRARATVRAELGLAQQAQVVLLVFGAFEAQIDFDALAELADYTFLLTPPLASAERHLPANIRQVLTQPPDYVSLVAACDVVVTKPGYGIVSDCLANRVPVLFTDRGPFREYDVLAAALLELGHARYVPRQDVLAGRLGAHLDALRNAPAAWQPLPTDGAQVVAERIMELSTIRLAKASLT